MRYCKSCNKTKGINCFRKFKNRKYSKTCSLCLGKRRKRKSTGKKSLSSKKIESKIRIKEPKTIFFYFRQHFRKVFKTQNSDLSLSEIDKLVMDEWRYDQETDCDLFEYFTKIAHKETLVYYKSLVNK